MAVYTEVSTRELTRFIGEYGIGRLLSSKGIAEGVENSNYLIHAESGFFILTLYEKRVKREDLPFFLGLMEHLAAKGITCPVPLKDEKDRVLRELAGRPAVIVTFLDGMSVRRPNSAHCAALGRALAQLHLAGGDFGLKRGNALSITGWRPLFNEIDGDADRVAPGLADEIAAELDFFDANWPTGLPEGVIHADLFPDNVFFLGDDLSGLIDFYFACNDFLAYDIAICLNAWCFEPDNAFNITKARAMLRAYSKVRELTGAEYDALPMLARGASLRFLLTRLYDWLNTPSAALVRPKDPMEYVKKLRFHRGIASTREYGLGD